MLQVPDGNLAGLCPYYGDWTQVHFGAERQTGRRHVTTCYPPDRSGLHTYTFNSLGFRGEEFKPYAKKTVFACGASFTIGVGVADEEVWTQHFKARYAAIHGYDTSEITVQNFAQGASSNDYTTRMLLSQCERVKPDLVIAHFGGDNRRTEWFSDNDHVSIGPWLADSGPRRRVTPVIAGFYAYYTPQLGALNTLKNVLLLQVYCRSRGIPVLCPWTNAQSTLALAQAHPICSVLAGMLDRDCIYQPRDAVDWAKEAGHPGPFSHQLFATQLIDMCQMDRLDLSSVLCRTAGLHLEEENGIADFPGNQCVKLSKDMLNLVRSADQDTPVSALLKRCFGVTNLSKPVEDQLVNSLKKLIRIGALHFRTSLPG